MERPTLRPSPSRVRNLGAVPTGAHGTNFQATDLTPCLPLLAELRIVLISRTASRLEEEARIIRDKYGVEVKIVPADLSSTDPEVFEGISKALEGLDIGILVNNAGMSYPYPEYLHMIDDEALVNLVTLNILTLTKV